MAKFEVVMTTEEIKKDRRKWLEARRTGIGGSDVAGVFGISKWKTAYQLWTEKTNQVPIEEETDTQNEYLHFGSILEAVVADEFKLRTGKDLRKQGLIRSVEHPWLLADVDRVVVGENAILECKTANAWAADDWEGDKIPLHYLMQVQTYMAVGGYDRCYVACLIGGNHFVMKTVERDEQDIKTIIDGTKKFWDEYVVQRKLPPADSSELYSKGLHLMYPQGKGELEMDDALEILCKDIIRLRNEELKIKETIRLLSNKVREKMIEYESAESEDCYVTYKSRKLGKLDIPKLKSELPKVYEKYYIQNQIRVLLVKDKKSKSESKNEF